MEKHSNRIVWIVGGLVLGLSLTACGGSSTPPAGGENPSPSGRTPDHSPDPISFAVPVIENMAPGLALASSPVIVKGVSADVTIPAAVDGGLMAINGSSDFVAGPLNVRFNDEIRVLVTAPDRFGESSAATLTVGEGDAAQKATFTLKTGHSTFSVEPGFKSLTFRWNEMAGLSHFELYENSDGASGYKKVDLDLPADSTMGVMDVEAVHLFDWENAVYQLHACNAAECLPLPGHETGVSHVANGVVPQMIKAANAGEDDYFGNAISMSGDGRTIAVGAFGENAAAAGPASDPSNDDADSSGAVYIYSLIDDSWMQTAYVKPEEGDAGDLFGISVALNDDGTVLAVGASDEDSSLADGGEGSPLDNAASDSGAAYIFRLHDDVWRQEAYLKSAAPSEDDQFGMSVALNSAGNVAAVGALLGDSIDPVSGDARPDTGAVHVYRHDNDQWSQDVTLSPAIADAGDYFGYCLDINGVGDVIAAGSFLESSAAAGVNGDARNNDAPESGAVYIFRFTSGWSQEAYIKAHDPGREDHFGVALSLDEAGRRLAIGAPLAEEGAVDGSDGLPQDSGTVYIFDRGMAGWLQSAYLKALHEEGYDWLGYSVGLSGDGTTLAAGQFGDDSTAKGPGGSILDNDYVNAGAALVFEVDSAGVWRFLNYLKASNTGRGDGFGAAIGTSRDGRRLVIGAMLEDSGLGENGQLLPESNFERTSGAVYIYE